MPRFGPIRRGDLIRALRRAGFSGPVPGGRHEAMRRGTLTVPIPNPHRGDIGRDLLREILRQAQITREEWERAFDAWIQSHDSSRPPLPPDAYSREQIYGPRG